MNRFSLQLEALGGRDMPSAGWAFDAIGSGEPVVEIQRNGGLAGSIDGVSDVNLTGGLAGSIDGVFDVNVTGGLSGGIEGAVGVAGGARGGIVELLGGALGGVTDRMSRDAVEIAGGLTGGVVGSYGLDVRGIDLAGGLTGGVVLGGAGGGVTELAGSPESRMNYTDDLFTPIGVDGSVETSARHIGEEIPQTDRSKGEEIVYGFSAGDASRPWEEIPT